MPLDSYRRKRKFDVTPEPRGLKARGMGHRYVIQKHAATRLHYDLRLELDGVMKSWAVTRGPSLVPDDKRLAVEVEDHPVEYNAFEGTIPQGEYGGGTVMIWDRGDWEPQYDPHFGLKKGHLEFTLHGEKLSGRWHLVRLQKRKGEKRNNWLLIKADDASARNAGEPDILAERPESVISGRSIEEIAAGKGSKRVWHSSRSVKDNVKAGATHDVGALAGGNGDRSGDRAAATDRKSKKASPGVPLPAFVAPALAAQRDKPPSGDGWVHEIKFDGYRTQARLDHGQVRLLTRKGLDWAKRFPNVAADIARLPAETALIDGEIVVENERGVPDFAMLQAALSGGARAGFIYYAFDLLHLDGKDFSRQPLFERKAALKGLLKDSESSSSIRYSEHFDADGTTVWEQACNLRLEGVVSKRRNEPYRSGRSDAFVKIKCADAQEFAVGGFAPSTGMPRAVGALVVGYYKDGKLHYAGRVGTGYTRATARDLWKRLHALEIAKPPFDAIPAVEARRRDVHWVRPTTVIEVQFRGWTGDGLIRQAAFKGVREDKPATEVVREMPAAGPRVSPGAKAAAGAVWRAVAARARPAASGHATNGVSIQFTHPERVYWPDVGVTKLELAAYYRSVWPWMAPHLINRPLSLLRCPEGIAGECFFQKHVSAGMVDEHLRSVVDVKKRQVIAVADLDGLLSLVQAGVLEVHVRGSMLDRLDRCDRIVFDIDPGESVPWSGIAAAAREVRDRLAALGLDSFVKLSGGKGVHVVLPVVPVGWEAAKTFAQAFAQAMAADNPDCYVAKIAKSLRKGRVFVDYLRNSLEQTSVAVYSTRARSGAPVSVPVTWDELARVTSASQYTVRNLDRRLRAIKRDPWVDIARVKQRLPDLKTLRKC